MDNKLIAMSHNVIIEDRRMVTISGVTDVESFDEQTVVLMTDLGELVVSGFGLHIQKIDVTAGDLILEGEVYSLTYADRQPTAKGLFGKLFR